MKPTFLASAPGSGSPEGTLPPFREGLGQRAPGGETFESDLPSQNGSSPFRDGFSPTPNRPAMPRPGEETPRLPR